MKKQFLFFLLLCLSGEAALAQTTQPCTVKQYNQKAEKTPLPGVEVLVSNAGSTVSDNAGQLTLVFRTLKPGDKVKLISAKKAGFALFNSEAVEQWNISRDQTPFTLVLVKKDYFDQLKAKLTQTSTDSYKRKYEQAIRDLEQQKKAGQLKEEEFNRKYDELEAQYQTQLSNLDNYIDQFARIDLSDVSAEEQRILEMVEAGQIDEAVKAYEELDISGKLRQARESKKELETAKARIEAEAALHESAIRELKAKQEREIATLKLAGGKENYDKIGRMLKEDALADTTDFDALWEYASFCKTQKNYREAERFYLMCLNACGDDSSLQDVTWNNLGFLYYFLRDYPNAEKYWILAWEHRMQLSAQNPDAYRHWLANVQLNLGLLFSVQHDYEKSEYYYLQALDNNTQLFNQDPDTYQQNLADTQLDLGLLYLTIRNYEKCEAYYLKALDNYTQLFNRDPDTYRASLSNIQDNLGYFYYSRCDDYDKAEKLYLEALEHRKILVAKNPDAYRMELARIQNDLGMLYRARKDYARAEEYYLQALDNITVAFNQSPDAYRVDLARTVANMGNFYRTVRNYSKAEECYMKAKELFTEMYNQNPNANRMDLARILNTMGFFYYTVEDYPKAEEYYLNSLEHRMILYERNPGVYNAAVAQVQINLSMLYSTTGQYDKALEAIDKAIAMTPDDADAYDSRGEILLKKGDTEGALQMWKKVLEMDPEYLSKNQGGTNLSNGLKEKGLIKD